MKEKKIIDLDTPLLTFGSGVNQAVWTLRDACSSTFITGATGAGKTSASGRMIALSLLKEGYGAFVTTVKVDDKETFLKYCHEAGRTEDVIVIEPGGEHRFNFLEYETQASGSGKAITANIVDLLMTVIEANSDKAKGTGDDGFWLTAVRMLAGNIIDVLLLAYGKVNIELLYSVLQSLPEPNEQNNAPTAFNVAYDLATKNVKAQVAVWEKRMAEQRPPVIFESKESYTKAVNDTLPDARTFSFLAEYFYRNFRMLSPKTKSVITYTLSGFLYNLLRDPVYSLFCNNASTVIPEDCFDGKIIVVNLPVLQFQHVGKSCQMIIKYCWQKAMEKRQITDTSLPVFTFQDEAQHFVFENDSDFQATARSSRVCSVLLTQNLPNFYIAMGGDKSEYRVKSLLGNFGTKFFHANTCLETNTWASDLIGEAEYYNPTNSYGFSTNDINQGSSESLQFKKQVRPEDFVKLKTGGPRNNFKVQAIIHRQGTPFPNGENYKAVAFHQQQNSQNNSL